MRSVAFGGSMIGSSTSRRPSAGQCCGECQGADLEGTRLEQRVSGRIERAARRQHIIDQPYSRRRAQAIRDVKCASHVLTSLTSDQLRLIASVMNPLEGIGEPRPSEAPRDSVGDRIDMVEASPAATAGVERDAHDEIRSRSRLMDDVSGELDREMVDRKSDRDGRAEGTSCVLEAGDPASYGAFVADQ